MTLHKKKYFKNNYNVFFGTNLIFTMAYYIGLQIMTQGHKISTENFYFHLIRKGSGAECPILALPTSNMLASMKLFSLKN